VKVLVVSSYPLLATSKKVTDTLKRRGVEAVLSRRFSDLKKVALKYDIIIVVGVDRDVLKAFHHLGDIDVPVLGVNTTETPSFLASLKLSDFEEFADRLLTKNYKIEMCPRLKSLIDDTPSPYALNEVAVFPYRSASLMEYRLEVNGEEVWRDYADGVIISTPLGSTAYAMSAGGPVVHPGSKVFVIVPVNSLDPSRRPLVIPQDVRIKISELNSRYQCETIIDGVYRRKVYDEIKVSLGPYARIIRIKEEHRVSEKMIKKIEISREIAKMPPSAKFVLKVLEEEGPLTLRALVKKTMLPTRTVQHALSILIRSGLVTKTPNLRDVRQDLYRVIKIS